MSCPVAIASGTEDCKGLEEKQKVTLSKVRKVIAKLLVKRIVGKTRRIDGVDGRSTNYKMQNSE